MNIVVVDIVYGVEFDADFIYANGFSHRALLDGQNEQIYVVRTVLDFCITKSYAQKAHNSQYASIC